MTLEPHIIYLDGNPRAITMAKDEAHAVESFRTAVLGSKVEGVVTAKSGWTAPVEDLMRVGLLGLYSRMFSADMSAMARAGGKH